MNRYAISVIDRRLNMRHCIEIEAETALAAKDLALRMWPGFNCIENCVIVHANY